VRERGEGVKTGPPASKTRHTGVSALRASRILWLADHWLTPVAIASRLFEPVGAIAPHRPHGRWWAGDRLLKTAPV